MIDIFIVIGIILFILFGFLLTLALCIIADESDKQ